MKKDLGWWMNIWFGFKKKNHLQTKNWIIKVVHPNHEIPCSLESHLFLTCYYLCVAHEENCPRLFGVRIRELPVEWGAMCQAGLRLDLYPAFQFPRDSPRWDCVVCDSDPGFPLRQGKRFPNFPIHESILHMRIFNTFRHKLERTISVIWTHLQHW